MTLHAEKEKGRNQLIDKRKQPHFEIRSYQEPKPLLLDLYKKKSDLNNKMPFLKDIDIPIQEAGGSKRGEIRHCGGRNTFFNRYHHPSSFNNNEQRRHKLQRGVCLCCLGFPSHNQYGIFLAQFSTKVLIFFQMGTIFFLTRARKFLGLGSDRQKVSLLQSFLACTII